jgi:hypothetical protein
LGLVTIDQVSPFQCSIRVVPRTSFAEPVVPTAKQSLELRQVIALNAEPVEFVGLGAGRTDQAEPFQRSASVLLTQPPVAKLPDSPTEKQLVVVGHERPLRPVEFFGLGTMDHLLPFQCSVNDATGPPIAL